MHITLFFYPLLAIFLFSGKISASEALSIEELHSLQKQMHKSAYLSADFDQTKIASIRPNRPVKSSGHAFFAKPGLFRWSLEKPKEEILIFNGKELYVVSPKENQAQKYPAGGSKAQELIRVLDMVLSFDTLLERYTVDRAEKAGDILNIQFKPKSSEEISKLDITYQLKEHFVSQLQIYFSNNNRTMLTFRSPSFDKIDASKFETPPGVKIVDAIK